MALSEDGLRSYQVAMAAFVGKIGVLPQPIIGGGAAALGTLSAMLKRIDLLLIALGSRAATDVDRNDLMRDASTLGWLGETKWIVEAFAGIEFILSDDAKSLPFPLAVNSLCERLKGTVA